MSFSGLNDWIGAESWEELPENIAGSILLMLII
jgi:hypothetical protein